MTREVISNTIEDIYNLSEKGFLVFKMLYENEWTKINENKYTVKDVIKNETYIASICKDKYGYWYYEVLTENLEIKYLRSFLLKDCTFISKDSNQFEEIFKKTKEVLLLYLKNNELTINKTFINSKDPYKIKINDFSNRFLEYFKKYGIAKEMLYSNNIYEIDCFENSYWHEGKNHIKNDKSRRSKLLIGFRFDWGWKIINTTNNWKVRLGSFQYEYVFDTYIKENYIEEELIILTDSEINVLVLKSIGYNAVMIENYKNDEIQQHMHIEINIFNKNVLAIYGLKEEENESKLNHLKKMNYKIIEWRTLIANSKKDKVFTIADYVRYNGSKNKLDKLIKSHLK